MSILFLLTSSFLLFTLLRMLALSSILSIMSFANEDVLQSAIMVVVAFVTVITFIKAREFSAARLGIETISILML